MSRYFLLAALAALVALAGLAPLRAADREPATIELILPPNSKVYVDDQLIRSTPGKHRLETPPLERMELYSYTFRVEIERDGKTVTFLRKFPVQAGKNVTADFRELATAPLDKPDPDKPKPDKVKSDKPKPDKPEGDKPNPDKPKPGNPFDDEYFKISETEKAIIDLTNAERKKKDLPELKPNPKLFAAARKHSENMARLDKLEHELDGKKPKDRVKEAGYPGGFIGENVAYGPTTAEEVVTGWMNSEGHRDNILNKNFTEIGVGVAKNEKGAQYFTQVFGKPAK
jgi:uncharacterized protein (TIGR03000 family)